MVFDRVLTGRLSIDYFKKNNNFIGEYVDCGSIRADEVFKVRNSEEVKCRIKKSLGVPDGVVIIGFFDGGFGDEGFMDNKAYLNMLSDIHLLLNTGDFYLVFKSRNAYKLEHEEAMQAVYRDLISHNRCVYINKKTPFYKAYNIAGICDMVIGDFFSSASLESVIGGVPTVLYAPTERFADDDFVVKGFDNFCAFSYEQLRGCVDYWLGRADKTEFSEFQNMYIKKYIDSYCDGRALSRLHMILYSRNTAKISQESTAKDTGIDNKVEAVTGGGNF
jgi:polysaccharide biosynthesis PFTS motif protein